MDVSLFRTTRLLLTKEEVTRAETVMEAPDGTQYKVFMLDADDTFDLVVHYPNGEREIVWSLVKEVT